MHVLSQKHYVESKRQGTVVGIKDSSSYLLDQDLAIFNEKTVNHHLMEQKKLKNFTKCQSLLE